MKKRIFALCCSLLLIVSALSIFCLFSSAEIVPEEWISVSSFKFASAADITWFASGSVSERPFFSLTPYTAEGFAMTISIDGQVRFTLTNNDPDARYTYGLLGVKNSGGAYYIQLYQSSTKSFTLSYPITDQSVISISVTYPTDYDTLSHLSSLSRLTVVNGEPVPHPTPAEDVPAQLTSIWSELADWFGDSFAIVQSVFWNSTANNGIGALTFAGTLSVIALGIAIFVFLIMFVRRFLQLRS